jgi:DNA-binding response OmpR family regulator
MADVLVVDDDTDTLELVTLILCRAGHSVLQVRRGTDVLTQVVKTHPDAIILDIMLPDLDGFSVAKEIRVTMPDPPPILFFTALGMPDDQATSRTLGDGYLTKPVRGNTLLEAVRKVLEVNTRKNRIVN